MERKGFLKDTSGGNRFQVFSGGSEGERGLEAHFKELKALAPEIRTLKAPVRFLKESSISSGPDWSLINWRYHTIRAIWDLVGCHPSEGVRSGRIDLIPAGNSSKNSDKGGEEEARREKRIERARKRLERLPRCGKEGHVLAVVQNSDVEVRFHPHRCHSVFCPYCAYENFKETFARLFPVVEELAVNGKLSFITLTHRNVRVESYEDVERAIDDAFRAMEKLYQFRLFGKRNWVRVKRETAREVLRYYRNSKKEYGTKEAREKARMQIAFIRDFERRYKDFIGSDLKFGQLFNAVVKFELTYNAERGEIHPHWHLLVADFLIPKVMLVVLWRMVSGSEIVDVRAVDSVKDATAELVKYITKGWEFPEGDIRLWVEACMLGRRKFRVWGFELLELEEGEKGEYIGFWRMRAELKYRKNLHEIPKLIRRMRRKGIKEVWIDRLIIYDERGKKWEVDLYLRDDGKLIIKDEAFTEEIRNRLDLRVITEDNWIDF